jgi:hypothetical protein
VTFSTRWLRSAPRATRRFLNAGRGATPAGVAAHALGASRAAGSGADCGRRGRGHVAVFRRAFGEHGGRRDGLESPAICPGVSGAWCSITSFPWTTAPTSRPSSFMRAHRFQTASDLRFGPGPRGTMTGPGAAGAPAVTRPRRVSRQRRCSEACALRWQGQIARATRGRDLHLNVPFPRKPPDLLMAESPPTGGLSAFNQPAVDTPLLRGASPTLTRRPA